MWPVGLALLLAAPAAAGTSDWTFDLAPTGDVYSPYIADPTRAGFAVQLISFSNSEIADAGDDRWGLKLGGRFGLFRIHPRNEPDRGFQLSIEAGFKGQFDRDHSLDNIGWDGIYGLIATYRRGNRLAYKLGALHTSAHVGDEHQERTGRQRIEYTRTELLAGASRSVGKRWRVYGEAGWACELRTPELQDRGRVQLGLEYESAPVLWKGRIGWYAAADASVFEERDWEVSTTVQAGFKVRTPARFWRLGLEYYDGRSWMAEYFQDDERYLSAGLWLDL